jgi:hypothetical protein
MKRQFTISDLKLIASLAMATDTDQAKRLEQKVKAMLRSSGNFEVMAGAISQGVLSSN